MGIPKGKKAEYISWLPEEEDNLQEWIARHKHLPWKEICREYFRQHGKRRSINSLRSKLEQLEKGIRRKRPATQRAPQHTRPAARHNRRSFLETLPAVPPPLVLKSPDPHAHRILQQWRQAEARQKYTVIERAPSTEEEPMSPLTPLDLEGLGPPSE
ncbi:hypothetical protein N7490_006322 [Penicillium lividum]|nr:hypothetical protein N7490_006322 [Penicillium lividum]